MTTYFSLLRQNVKLVSMFSPKHGENSGKGRENHQEI